MYLNSFNEKEGKGNKILTQTCGMFSLEEGNLLGPNKSHRTIKVEGLCSGAYQKDQI